MPRTALVGFAMCSALSANAWYSEPPSTAVWMYRVPLVLPAGGAVNSTIKLDVDFNVLFTQLGLNAATYVLDESSIRIVRGNETRAAQQEFNDSVYNGAADASLNERGEIRFILQDLPAAGTYYLYFDATNNGTKPANPATVINGTFEQSAGSVPTQWTTAAVNAGTNRNNEVYRTTVTSTVSIAAGCQTTALSGIDASPNNAGGVATGSAWHLLGFRDRCEDGSGSSESIRLSRTISIPTGAAAGNLDFYFQVQGYDGISNATSYDWVSLSVNGATIDHRNLGISNTTTPTLTIDAARVGRSGYSATYLDHRWKRARLALSPYAGQAIDIRFETRHYASDNDYRSWVKLDDVEWSVLAATLGTPESFAGNIRGFRLSHSGYGIYCRDETVQVSAIDNNGNVATGYVGQITLTTQSGLGDWLLTTGGGTLANGVADDGIATYQFVAADSGRVTVRLAYRSGTTPIDVDVYQSDNVSLRDDDTEGLLAFAPSGFTVTGVALSNPPPNPINSPIATQIAGTNFPLHIAAYGQTDTDPVCGVIETYTGAKSLSFWMDRVDPNTGTLVATVNGAAVGATEAAATAHSVTFAQGQAAVTVKYKDVGQIRMQLKDPTALPQVIRGSSNAFVVRPATMTISRVETLGGVANPGATTAVGPAFVAAGSAFRVEVDVRDAENSLTPNYGRESAPEGIRVASATLVIPAGGRNGSSGTGALLSDTAFAATATLGRFRNDAIAFDEVGIIRLVASIADGSYLGTGPLTGTVSGNVGRFRVASFDLNPGSAVTPACGSFTYMSQAALGVSYVLEARNSLAARVWNYDAALLGAGAVATVVPVAENADSGIDLGARLSGAVGTWTLGRSAVATAAASLARLGSADGPFGSLQIGVRVVDGIDGVVVSSPNMRATTVGNCAAAANCDAVTVGSASAMRYGRMMVKGAFGPETSNLAVPLEAQYFDGSLFAPNTLDNCSTYRIGLATLSTYTDNLAFGETVLLSPAASTALVAGASNPVQPLLLSAPNIGNDGSVSVTLDVPSYLEFDWLGTGDRDPFGTARFGRYRGHDRIILWRER